MQDNIHQKSGVLPIPNNHGDHTRGSLPVGLWELADLLADIALVELTKAPPPHSSDARKDHEK